MKLIPSAFEIMDIYMQRFIFEKLMIQFSVLKKHNQTNINLLINVHNIYNLVSVGIPVFIISGFDNYSKTRL